MSINTAEVRTPEQQLQDLRAYIRSKGSMAIAFSGGVDSTFLLKVAHDELGDKCIAVTGRSCTFPGRELKESEDFCRSEGIRQVIVDTDELDTGNFAHNPKNRCYLCKKELFTKVWQVAHDEGFKTVAEASNMDDNGDYRPGLMAVSEMEALSPLRHCGIYKQTIRGLSKELGLKTWDKPAMACLSSRFVYGEDITPQKLIMVEEAEQYLMDQGFRACRVRIHGNKDFLARIEVPVNRISDLFKNQLNQRIQKKFKDIGFTYVTIDAGGYRSGSMNDVIASSEKHQVTDAQSKEIVD